MFSFLYHVILTHTTYCSLCACVESITSIPFKTKTSEKILRTSYLQQLILEMEFSGEGFTKVVYSAIRNNLCVLAHIW